MGMKLPALPARIPSSPNLAIGSNSKQHFASFSSDMPFVSCVTFKDILCDWSPEPYTLNFFLIFLSRDHCIETLDFIIDAEAYCDIYHANRTSLDDKNTPRNPMLIGKQWEHLMATYICLGSPSEINLPSCIRHRLLDIVSDIVSYPSPEQLTSAGDHAYEILTENVLVPFIRSFHLAENHDMYELFISTWTAQSLNQLPRSLLDNSITERTEPTTQPKGFQIKLLFFIYCKFRRWFSSRSIRLAEV